MRLVEKLLADKLVQCHTRAYKLNSEILKSVQKQIDLGFELIQYHSSGYYDKIVQVRQLKMFKVNYQHKI